ncbi:CsxC family protein [Priestia abyssalis]|uniref:CsxC family protein n=1 Tax=Priestia abyssalis TaxID=1221450 RepID=UPI000994B41C|nr:hypothetical protein [Priestia abyssalis]
MKKNTGCGCNDHHGCPPAPHCGFAHVKATDCFVDNVENAGSIEQEVIVADVRVQALVEADVDLPTPAREIKYMRKNVSLKQCEAFPSQFNSDIIKLFVTGVVHKNIQYVEACSGFVRDFSVDVPFHCNLRVEDPTIDTITFDPSDKNALGSQERRFIAKNGHEGDRCRFGGESNEDFNEPIRCKLLAGDVFEFDLPKDFDRFGRFNKLTEKMEVLLTIRLLQTRRV